MYYSLIVVLADNKPYGTYVGVFNAYATLTPVSAFVTRLLAYFTGTTRPVDSEKDCKRPKHDEVSSNVVKNNCDINKRCKPDSFCIVIPHTTSITFISNAT